MNFRRTYQAVSFKDDTELLGFAIPRGLFYASEVELKPTARCTTTYAYELRTRGGFQPFFSRYYIYKCTRAVTHTFAVLKVRSAF